MNIQPICRVLIILISATLSACSGGQNQASHSDEDPIAQTLIFDNPGPVQLYVGDTFENPANGPGDGEVNYTSSNPGVAEVDSNGLVTAKSDGTAEVNSNKEADSRYAAASSSYEVIVDLRPNPLSFENSGPVKELVGTNYTNTAKSIDAAISYKSGDPYVASVDAGGRVSIHSAGTTRITATQNSDGVYTAAEATYLLEAAPKSFSMSAWIGTKDTQVTFSPETGGLEFYRSTQLHCNLESFNTCDFGQRTILNNQLITDTSATTNQASYYSWQHGEHITRITVSVEHFSNREHHQVVQHDGSLWLIGGVTTGAGDKNDVWKSSDGISWTLVTSNAAFSPREEHQVVSHAGKLWLIGGFGDSSRKNDVWSSEDGKIWTEVTPNADFSPRTSHQAVSYKGKLWVIGGNAVVAKNDVWSSADGINWVEETGNAGLPPREGHTVLVHNDRLWLTGGLDFGSRMNDVWFSQDGVNWKSATSDAGFSARWNHQFTSHAGKLWIIGGDGGELRNDVWSSSDGKTWILETTNAAFYPRQHHQAISHNEQLLLIGGVGDDHTSKGDIWTSKNGRDWKPVSSGPPFSPRTGHQVVAFDDKFWLIGGNSNTPTRGSRNNEIWSSTDGTTWKLEKSHADFSARTQHQVVNYAGKLWLVGGIDPVRRNDVWRSDDGINWTQLTDDAAFSPRREHQLVVHQNKLWLIGGDGGDINGLKDVWWSTDGIHWTEVIPNNEFTPRYSHQVVSFAGKLWLVGGFSAQRPRRTIEIWSSADGVAWTKEVEEAPFQGRSDHQLVVHNNFLWLIGGLKGGIAADLENDVWKSADGIHWTLVNEEPEFSARRHHQAISKNGELWIVGGSSDNFFQLDDVWRSSDGNHWRKLFTREVKFPEKN